VRIVSLVPSLTELAVHLGRGDDLVGVTRFCIRPEGLRDRPGIEVVGGTKAPAVDRILARRPDLVLANREENERETVEALRDAGVEVLVTDVRTVADAEREILAVGGRLGRLEPARVLAHRIGAARAEARKAAEGRAAPRLLVLVWRDPWMAAGPDTYLSSLLEEAGGRNVVADPEPRYPERNDEELRAAAPDLVLLPSEPYPFGDEHSREIEALGLRVARADGELLTWYGPRTPDGLRHAAHLLAQL
jgi:ABC-type Fe3+-hydroxamate transport system substrate-binding protein